MGRLIWEMGGAPKLPCWRELWGTLAAFDNGVTPIVMHRCIVSLKYGTETGKFWFTYDRQPAAAVATHRWNCEQKEPDVEIPCGRDCGLGVLKGTSVPSKFGCNFLVSSSPQNLSTGFYLYVHTDQLCKNYTSGSEGMKLCIFCMIPFCICASSSFLIFSICQGLQLIHYLP